MRWTDLRTGYPCNQRCRFCDQAGRSGDASTPEVAAAMAAIPHREGLVLAGGEVTLRPDLPELIVAARAMGFRRVGLQSNGQIFAARGVAEALRQRGLTDLAVALHAPEAVTHDWLTDTSGSWSRCITGIKNAKKAGISLRIHAVATRTSTPLLPELVRLAARLGVGVVRVSPARAEGRAVADARMLAPRLSLLAEAISGAVEVGRGIGVEVETLGMPLCLAPELPVVAADRLDGAAPSRVFAVNAEPEHTRLYAENCGNCRLRPVCPGLEPAYLTRWGSGELLPVGGAPPAPTAVTILLNGDARRAKQALVAAHGRGVTAVRFDGPAEEAAAMKREADRLGLVVRNPGS